MITTTSLRIVMAQTKKRKQAPSNSRAQAKAKKTKQAKDLPEKRNQAALTSMEQDKDMLPKTPRPASFGAGRLAKYI